MSSIDSRIVTMKFENRDFQRGVDTTISALGRLGKILDGGFTSKAFSGIGNVASKFDLTGMSSQVEGLNSRFLALGTVAVTALARITNSAIDASLNFAKQFSGLAGAQAGFQEYETNLNSIQTILANTDGENLDDVNRALDQLNHYSDKTIYNFAEMARNIGTFTAAGVDLDTSVNSIKGIANLAALSGSNSSQASTAMYQLSQAIAAGRVSLMDWNSVVNAGMGGKVFQEALARTAVNMGAISEGAVGAEGPMKRLTIEGKSFRESISGGDSWLTSDVLTNTLQQFSGDITEAQLKSQGYTKAQIDDIMKLAKTAENAATKVKTFTQLIGTIRETIGSGWSQTWRTVIGDFTESKKLWTGVNETIGGFFNRMAQRRNRMLADWKDMGGRNALLDAFSNLFQAFLNIIRPIRNAFHDIFPRATGEQLANITKAFRDFTKSLIVSKKTSGEIRDVFRGIFTVFKIVGIVIGAAIKYIAEFFGILVSGGGGSAILAIAAAIGRVVTAIGDWLTEGGRLQKFFDAIIQARNAVLKPLVGTIGAIVEAFVALASGDTSAFFDKMGSAGDHILELFDLIRERLGALGDFFASVFGTLAAYFSSLGSDIGDVFASAFATVADAFQKVRDALSFGGDSASNVLDSGPIEETTNQLSKLSGVARVAGHIWDALKAALLGVGSISGEVLTALGHLLTAAIGSVTRMFEHLDFDQILQLINTGIFAKLAFSLSNFFDTVKDVGGVATDFRGMLNEVTGSLKTMQTSLKVGMIKDIAIAVGILAASMIGLSLIPKDKLKSSLITLSTLMGEVAAMLFVMGKLGSLAIGLVAVGPTMIGIAIAIGILSGSLRLMAGVPWDGIIKGGVALAGMTAALYALGAAGPATLAGGAAILFIAPAMVILAGALKLFDKVNWGSMAKAGVALVAISVALGALGAVGPAVLAGGAAMLIAAPALTMIAGALILFKKVDWSSLGKLAVMLLAVSVGLTAMVAAIPGAWAMMVLAGALTIMIGPLKALAAMDFWSVVKAFASLGVGLAALGVITLPLIPVLAALSLVIGALGLGMLATGAGFFLFATGLSIVAAAGTAAFTVLISGITAFLAVLPQWIEQMGQSLVALAHTIRDAVPAITEASVAIIKGILKGIEKISPQLAITMIQLIHDGLAAIRATFPDFVDTGIAMLYALLDGLDKNMKKLTQKGVDVAVKFIDGVGNKMDEINDAAVRLIIKFVNGLSTAIDNHSGEMGSAGARLGISLAMGIVSGMAGMVNTVVNAALDLGHKAVNAIHDAIKNPPFPSREGISLGYSLAFGFARGIENGHRVAERNASGVAKAAMDALGKSLETTSGSILGDKLNLSPTVTPVLDLSQVASEAGKMGAILDTKSINASVSYGRALDISNERQAVQAAVIQATTETPAKELKFEQTIHSPKALSEVEIYRNTKSLFAMAKEALETS